ncbi:RidA family protein [uncultured Croceitalea sp.]|uniref:RidA family protein n=1 Tax=uncultured Croceitalea sp. TaxID=1798908 RepID=UPI00374E7474
MNSKTIKDKAKPLGNYPHIKRVGDYIFVSGTSSRRPDNTHIGATQKEDGSWDLDISLQTEAVIKNIEALIKNKDASLADVVDITTFLVDMKDFKDYNKVYGQFFDTSGPTRTTVAVHQLPHPNLLIEIKALVYKPLK